MGKQEKQQTKSTDTDNSIVVLRGKRDGEVAKGKGANYLVTEKDLTWGAGHMCNTQIM